jgi:hypothetical protein
MYDVENIILPVSTPEDLTDLITHRLLGSITITDTQGSIVLSITILTLYPLRWMLLLTNHNIVYTIGGNSTMIKCLKECLDKNGNWHITSFRRVERLEKNKLVRAYNFLWLIYQDKALSLSEMYKLYRQNIFQPIRCLECGATVHPRKGKVSKQFGFALFCSIACLSKSNYRKDLIYKTCTEKYGGVGFGNSHHRNKACKTMKEKYGVEYYVLAANFEEERTKTYQEKYGVSSPMKSTSITNTHRQNMFNKHGVSNSFCKGIL